MPGMQSAGLDEFLLHNQCGCEPFAILGCANPDYLGGRQQYVSAIWRQSTLHVHGRPESDTRQRSV